MPERERWPSRWGFVFAAIGSAIGLGNVWRFPYLAYKYGGGAFLIPYFVCLVLIGIPWFIAEMGMGQIMQRGAPGTMGKIGKKYEWAGWFSVLIAFVIVCYYTVIMAWSVVYLVSSLTLAWGSGPEAADGVKAFFNQTLGLTSGPGEWGGYSLSILAGLLFTWIAIYWFIYKGPERLGKLVRWTVIGPWVLLVVLFIRGISLPGSLEGLNFYLTPDFSALKDGEVWFAAVSQIAFTLSLGMAIMFAYGSYNPRRGDINNNSIITSFADAGTAFFGGFVVFSSLGYVSIQLGVPIDKVAGGGIGLAFETFPVAISMMPVGAQIIGLIFFMCLWLLGIDSAFSCAEAVATPLADKWGIPSRRAVLLVCIFGFLGGAMVFAPGAGLYWLDMVDRGVSFYGLIMAGIVQILIIGWVYGADKLRQQANAFSDVKIGPWLNWVLKYIVPLGLSYVLIWGIVSDLPSYGGYPIWATLIGVWGILLAVIAGALLLGSGSKSE
jgi:NSS family neurotransmitter:Na+ symporter